MTRHARSFPGYTAHRDTRVRAGVYVPPMTLSYRIRRAWREASLPCRGDTLAALATAALMAVIAFACLAGMAP